MMAILCITGKLECVTHCEYSGTNGQSLPPPPAQICQWNLKQRDQPHESCSSIRVLHHVPLKRVHCVCNYVMSPLICPYPLPTILPLTSLLRSWVLFLHWCMVYMVNKWEQVRGKRVPFWNGVPKWRGLNRSIYGHKWTPAPMNRLTDRHTDKILTFM